MAISKSQTRTVRTGNGIKSTGKPPSDRATAKSAQPQTGTLQDQAQALLKMIQQFAASKYKVKLQLRDKRVSTKVGHAAREKLGLDLAAQVKKSGKQFNWNDWNNKIFPKLFGKPDALKYEPEVMAIVLSLIYDTVSLEPEQGVRDLVEFNRASLERRNSFQQQEDEEDDELDDDLDEILDEEEDELGDEEDEELDDDDFEDEDEE